MMAGPRFEDLVKQGGRVEEVEAPPPEAQGTGAAPAPVEAPDPGLLRTLGSQFLAGVSKQGSDEATGALGALLNPSATGADDSGDLYRTVRDRARGELAGGAKARPVTASAANMAGDVAGDVLLRALGVPVASAGYQTATGALSGLMGSEAELTSKGRSAKDILSAAGATGSGAALARVAPVVGRHAGQLLRALTSRARGALGDVAISQGRRVLQNATGTLDKRLPISEGAVREALDSGAIRPLSTTQGALERLETRADDLGGAYGAIVEGLERQGVTGPNARALADELLAKAKALELTETNKAIPGAYRDTVTDLLDKAEMAEQRGLAPTGRLALTQAEGIKRSLQGQARYGKWEETPLNEARRDIASTVRRFNESAVEDAGMRAPKGSEVAQMAEEFVPIKRTLANVLEAREAAQRGAARGANRSAVGLPEYVMASGASGGPAGQALTALLTNQLRNRGASTAAVAANAGQRALGAVPDMTANLTPAALRQLQLVLALRGGKKE